MWGSLYNITQENSTASISACGYRAVSFPLEISLASYSQYFHVIGSSQCTFWLSLLGFTVSYSGILGKTSIQRGSNYILYCIGVVTAAQLTATFPDLLCSPEFRCY